LEVDPLCDENLLVDAEPDALTLGALKTDVDPLLLTEAL
jgi:hypothetical protein